MGCLSHAFSLASDMKIKLQNRAVEANCTELQNNNSTQIRLSMYMCKIAVIGYITLTCMHGDVIL